MKQKSLGGKGLVSHLDFFCIPPLVIDEIVGKTVVGNGGKLIICVGIAVLDRLLSKRSRYGCQPVTTVIGIAGGDTGRICRTCQEPSLGIVGIGCRISSGIGGFILTF